MIDFTHIFVSAQPEKLYRVKASNLVLDSEYHLAIQGINTNNESIEGLKTSITFTTPTCFDMQNFSVSLCRKQFAIELCVRAPNTHFRFLFYNCQRRNRFKIWPQRIHWSQKVCIISTLHGIRSDPGCSQFITMFQFYRTILKCIQRMMWANRSKWSVGQHRG